MSTTVINIKDIQNGYRDSERLPENHVYIGRPSKWGNPYAIGQHGTREEVVEQYRFWLYSGSPAFELDEAITELKDKVLVCFCKPLACHGDVLAELADS